MSRMGWPTHLELGTKRGHSSRPTPKIERGSVLRPPTSRSRQSPRRPRPSLPKVMASLRDRSHSLLTRPTLIRRVWSHNGFQRQPVCPRRHDVGTIMCFCGWARFGRRCSGVFPTPGSTMRFIMRDHPRVLLVSFIISIHIRTDEATTRWAFRMSLIML